MMTANIINAMSQPNTASVDRSSLVRTSWTCLLNTHRIPAEIMEATTESRMTMTAC